MVAAGAGDRTISFYHIHTKETLTVTYKKAGSFVPEAMKQIDWIMRDWRKNQSIKMDAQTIDLIWEMHTELGSQQPVSIICGYRSSSTNSMLRRTVGGQASQSQHITGKAIDVTFPDVPLKRMRYSALVRERGGVGYYPTSGIPFVHVDTARVRSWPRLPRFELALLFPEGRSRHMPQDGGPINASDVRIAQSKYRELAVQIAQFHDTRHGLAAPTLVASASPLPPPDAPAQKPQPKLAMASLTGASGSSSKPPATAQGLVWQASPPASTRKFDLKAEPQQQVAALTPAAAPVKPKLVPSLVAEPKLVERTSRFAPSPSTADRNKLAALARQAATMPMPQLVAGPAPAVRPQKALAAAAAAESGNPAAPAAGQQVASLAPEKLSSSITDMSPDSLGSGWVQAPAFDEDHPEELSYRPFPLAPLLTETSSIHDPQLAGLQHPDVAATLDALDDDGTIAPMKFRSGPQVAQVMWAQQFQGKAVHVDALEEIEQSRLPKGMENRSVRTSVR